MANLIQLRRDTALNWFNSNPIPAEGEPCVETDTGKFKFGNAVDHYNDLLYATGNAPSNPAAFSTMIAQIAIVALDLSAIRVGTPIAFALTYESLYPVTAWAWDFDDGQHSTLPCLNKTYGTPGAKHVSCTLTDSQNNSVVAYYDLNVQGAQTADVGQQTLKVDAPLLQLVHSPPVIDQDGTVDAPATLLQTPAPVINNAIGVNGTDHISQLMDTPVSGITHSLTITNT
jgi:hypothetical protein